MGIRNRKQLKDDTLQDQDCFTAFSNCGIWNSPVAWLSRKVVALWWRVPGFDSWNFSLGRNYSKKCTVFLLFSLFFLVLSSEEVPALCWTQVRGGPSIVQVFLYVVHRNRDKWYKGKEMCSGTKVNERSSRIWVNLNLNSYTRRAIYYLILYRYVYYFNSSYLDAKFCN